MTVLLARIARRAGRGRAAGRRTSQARIAAAGTPLGLGPADVAALKAAGALIGALLALPVATALPGRLWIVALLCAPAAGFLAPDLMLARRARARAARMSHELADVLDLLRVAVQAGLSVGRALAEVGRRCQRRARRRAAARPRPACSSARRATRRSPSSSPAARSTASRRSRPRSGGPTATARRWRPRSRRSPPRRAPSRPAGCATRPLARRPRSSSSSRSCSCRR